MTYSDERILERLDESRQSLTPWMLAFDLDEDRRHVYHRCRILAHAGLVDLIPREQKSDKVELSTWGKLYLEGEVDAQNRRPCPAPRPPDKVRPDWFAGFM
jgi:hypothetical protein